MIQFDGIGATTEKGISGLESGYEFEGIDDTANGFVVFLQLFPFTLPHDNDTTPKRTVHLLYVGWLRRRRACSDRASSVARHHGPGNTWGIRANNSCGIRR